MNSNRMGPLRPFQHTPVLIYSLGDISAIWLIFMLVSQLRHVPLDAGYLTLGLCATFAFYLIANMRGLYQSTRCLSFDTQIRLIFESWVAASLLMVVGLFAIKTSADFSRIFLASWVLMTPILLAAIRMLTYKATARLMREGKAGRRVVIAGAGDLGHELARVLSENALLGLQTIAFYDDNWAELKSRNVPVLGDLNHMIIDARSEQFDEIFIALPMRFSDRIKDIIEALADCPVTVNVVPDVFSFSLLHGRWRDLGGIPAISVHDSPLYGGGGILKRIEDIVLASLILLVIAIPMACIALTVKLTSPGPVLFRQRRYGLGGIPVMIWKFRTMTVCEDGDHIPQATRSDRRVTPLGRFLRRTSLDELPQFFNVLQGHMSIVGPRPHAIAHNELYRKDIHGYMLRHLVKPGITGWAQVNGWRGETDTLEKMQNRVQYDLDYIRNWSLRLDLRIIFMTVFKGFSDHNAY